MFGDTKALLFRVSQTAEAETGYYVVGMLLHIEGADSLTSS